MAKCDKLLKGARTTRKGVRFAEAIQLAECWGFNLARQRGSHVILARVGYWRTVNLQDDHGMAKPYEIDQLLEAIEDLIDQGIAAGE
jgi:hypothetical protein